MTTFKQKALEALNAMQINCMSGGKFTMEDQNNQTVRDCISRIEAIEEDGWIKVEERLPDIMEKVLILTKTGAISIDTYIGMPDTFKVFVTHFMKIPQSPK